jgi:hypothetical protein
MHAGHRRRSEGFFCDVHQGAEGLDGYRFWGQEFTSGDRAEEVEDCKEAGPLSRLEGLSPRALPCVPRCLTPR